eukprot:m.386902 g.386902  ORF g.386902 m.386902 type:complete len:604 (-) comp56307_c0_seq12:92-1903(-)
MYEDEKLPALPVGSLAGLVAGLRRSLLPALAPADAERVAALIDDFIAGPAPALQEQLQQRAATSENWLSEWWMNLAYLSYRLPLLIHSSPAMLYPEFDGVVGKQFDQTARASQFLHSIAVFHLQVCCGEVEPLMQGTAPLSMSSFPQLLGTTRLPALPADRVVSVRAAATDVLIAYQNQFFVFPLFHPSGAPLSETQMSTQIQRIKTSAFIRHHRVGILTTADRDSWARWHAVMMESSVNQTSFQRIEKALVLLALDDESPSSKNAMLNYSLHGNGSSSSTSNRWFDKSYQIVVAANGVAGTVIEHTLGDGIPYIKIADYTLTRKHVQPPSATLDPQQSLPQPQQLHWEVSDEILRAIDETSFRTDALIASLDLQCFEFTDYAKPFLKKAGLSPDAFFQMAMQIAYFRLHREFTATYESGHTLAFKHGRTETIRTVSAVSIAFVNAFVDVTDWSSVGEPTPAFASCFALLQEACGNHTTFTRQCLAGNGIDRHLLGLRILAGANGISPPLFSDPAFKEFNHFKLSSSCVPDNYGTYQCFGPVAEDGYGVCYSINRDENMTFSASSFRTCATTDTARFGQAVISSLRDMRKLCEGAQTLAQSRS